MWKFVQTTILIGTMTLSLVGLQGVAAESQRLQTVTLQIDGMTCGACVKDVKAALAKVSSVSSVEITVGEKWLFFLDYADVRAAVTFDQAQCHGTDQDRRLNESPHCRSPPVYPYFSPSRKGRGLE